MKVLVIGSGAREHALCWKIKQSKKVSKLYCAPGNAGIEQVAECVNIKAESIDELIDFSVNNKIDLVVIGPEGPLVDGIVDKLKNAGIRAFGPTQKGAILEGSKAYSKNFMNKYSIPTARYEVYDDANLALEGIKKFNLPVVIKADGLAAGKGVVICQSIEEATDTINNIMKNKQFGEAGNTIVIEEYLVGTEASLLCFVDGNKIIPMESARDYKKAFDNDKGLNTGGMGCFSPNPIYNKTLKEYINKNILYPTLKGFKEEGIDFKGVLFIGLMINDNMAKVLEYNVRFGDPETEVILPRLKSDLIEIMEKCIDGNLQEEDLKWTDKNCLTVIIASGGYPEKYEKGKEIKGLEAIDSDLMIFHGGSKNVNNKIITDGGRVLAVTSLGSTLEEARSKVYKNITNICFDNMYYRKDIGKI